MRAGDVVGTCLLFPVVILVLALLVRQITPGKIMIRASGVAAMVAVDCYALGIISGWLVISSLILTAILWSYRIERVLGSPASPLQRGSDAS